MEETTWKAKVEAWKRWYASLGSGELPLQTQDVEFGHMLCGVLEDQEVETKGIRFDAHARTAPAFDTLHDDGERGFMFYRNPSADAFFETYDPDTDLLKQEKVFCVQPVLRPGGDDYDCGAGRVVLRISAGEIRPSRPLGVVAKLCLQSVAKVSTSGSIGTGFAVTDVLVLTNYHVIKACRYPQVTFPDGVTCSVEVVDFSESGDLALLKIPESYVGKLKPIVLGSSKDLELMQKVFAIGHPTSDGATVTSGKIAAFLLKPIGFKGLNVKIGRAFQIDGNIVGGHSGGPVFNHEGHVVGVVFGAWFNCTNGGSSGIGYAMRVESVLQMVEKWM